MRLDLFNQCVTRVAFATWIVAALASPRLDARAAASPVTITAVAVADSEITITGKSFGTAPTVTLGGVALAVAENSDTEIVARVPALRAGIYKLTVARGGATSEDVATTSVIIQ